MDTLYSFHREELVDAITFIQTTYDKLTQDQQDVNTQVTNSTAIWTGQDKVAADDHRQQWNQHLQPIIDHLMPTKHALERILSAYDVQEQTTARMFAT